MKPNFLTHQDTKNIMRQVQQGNTWHGIVYSSDIWRVKAYITPIRIDFVVDVKYKNGKGWASEVEITHVNRSYNFNIDERKIPINIREKMVSVFVEFERMRNNKI